MNVSVLKKKRGDEREEKECVCRASYLPEINGAGVQNTKISDLVLSFFFYQYILFFVHNKDRKTSAQIKCVDYLSNRSILIKL
jgi:hypothetical protein